MDIQQLKLFLSVAQALNFTEAARRNGVPQPTVSRSILELENQMGAQLFTRNKRSVHLTLEGEALVPYARDMVDTAERAAFAVGQIHTGLTGHISVSTLPTTSRVLTACLSEFTGKYPDVFVDIAQTDGGEQERALREVRHDFFFAQLAMLPKDLDHLDYLETHRDSLVLVVPKGHPIAGKALDFSQLHRERFIMLHQRCSPLLYDQITALCSARHFTPRVAQRYDKAESVLLSVGAGLGVTILPHGLTRILAPDSVETVPIPAAGIETVYVCAWQRDMPNPSAKLFLEVVRDYFDR